jgi:hypothetical protein
MRAQAERTILRLRVILDEGGWKLTPVPRRDRRQCRLLTRFIKPYSMPAKVSSSTTLCLMRRERSQREQMWAKRSSIS